ncbi:hypothetical protein PR048_025019 [Dryococelus australis]|uniref:Uncharacterized protein n=1 Tax=Dryococelus australis TaxID=614101 RepID=A0ABQ9GQ86_9NEOP|nr:hypothetical protein PR048_025019 [Dryococelus australis]
MWRSRLLRRQSRMREALGSNPGVESKERHRVNFSKLVYTKIGGAKHMPPPPFYQNEWGASAPAAPPQLRHRCNRVQSPAGSPDFYTWESCRTMPSVGGFPRGSPVSPALSFRRCSMLTSIILIDSQDLVVKSRPDLFTHSV